MNCCVLIDWEEKRKCSDSKLAYIGEAWAILLHGKNFKVGILSTENMG
jgi:hypothetical protein